ncbi:acyl-ACP--UDP-N-acetylglucosamine O-acyltransferase [Prosthecochloris sp. N3]|uniref:Acyl-[acyl-carrier-protein]--UDP-N-acetylglucosamine O-acyltransferase n=1 Tax=Prosthecochloris ethylica TaxID=2743976 RepID=A0ABR9XNZ8_9CHLB|nr:acyl-ACP--UDP-N-acetylglucosamine O-acyltransferase [Prosthecochloris ethylica]MBF0585823.1 acyl-ACP--UDP-N-acetylglucosamine O-acyltransferase [Prosthecochloris ethylica]MBF0635733.1 acyl-ACP--UDP-N-acetylglucosamine O-acyltransferase [Prosthecochloris ethylica]NUK47031.1 acyl-ACP--UDP-N-acetylglucosamine O-acyltransferase [Prosthecochloris ethylica]
MSTTIHPTAVVGAHAEIGEGVTIGPYSVIDDDVVIGDGTDIGPHVQIADGARIGRECRIFAGAVLSTVPQDLKFQGERTFLHVGDRTVIRECVTLNRGTKASGKTVVGSDCLIMAYVHAGHDCRIGNKVIIANSVQFGGHCDVDDYAVVGGLAGVHQFVRIGRYAMVGGISRASLDVPPFVMAGGHERFRFEGLNHVGLKRRGFTSKQIDSIRHVYRILFQRGLLLRNALQSVREECEPGPERDEILAFFDSGSAKRKYIRPYNA